MRGRKKRKRKVANVSYRVPTMERRSLPSKGAGDTWTLHLRRVCERKLALQVYLALHAMVEEKKSSSAR